jgi:serine/threonine protein kinase
MTPSQGRFTNREVAGYRLVRLLGRGGTSEVYLAERLSDASVLAAVKVLTPSGQLSADERTRFAARFRREAEASLRLHHPHILPVLSYGEDSDVAYMVLPFISGGTLATRLAQAPGGLPLDEIAGDLDQLAEALDFAHAQGVIHRDIKPTNVLLDGQGQLYLADFGIARLFDPSGDADDQRSPTPLTQTGQVLGTPLYMAPEQLTGARVGPAADIYSLGIVVYQLVTGNVPFYSETPVGLALQHVHDSPPPPRARRPDLPAPAAAALLRARQSA